MSVRCGRCTITGAAGDGRRRSGFTTLELILVIAIFAMTAAVTLPFVGRFRQRATLATEARTFTRTLRRAQHKTMAGERGVQWGVRVQPRAYVLYAGSGYAARNPDLDERHALEGMTFRQTTDIRFDPVGRRLTGSGTIVLLHRTNERRRIDVNPAGGIFLRSR